MTRRFLPLLACLAAARLAAADPVLSAPAKNWSVIRFTRDNFHSLTVRGTEARLRGEDEVDVKDLNLTVFVGDATNHVESILLSPAAIFHQKENFASGDQGVRLIRDDLEATGTQWTYHHANKNVSLHGNVRIVVNAELKDLLK